MRRPALRCLLLLGCWGLAGCVTFNSGTVPPPPDVPNAFLDELFEQEVLPVKPLAPGEVAPDPKSVPSQRKTDMILQEIPLGTPVAKARAIMELHSFTCFGGIQDNYRTCLYCTACRLKTKNLADRMVVKLYYEQQRVVDVEVMVEANLARGFWGTF